jgi:DNA-binding response OmpR family regulator
MGCRVLVVEDEPLLALDVTEALTAAGAEVTCEYSVADARVTMALIKIDAALVDIKLNGQDASPLCRLLAERPIPFVFHSGYSTAPDGWDHIPIVEKPASREEIVEAVGRLYGARKQAA